MWWCREFRDKGYSSRVRIWKVGERGRERVVSCSSWGTKIDKLRGWDRGKGREGVTETSGGQVWVEDYMARNRERGVSNGLGLRGERERERREVSGRCGSRIVCVREAGGLLWIRGKGKEGC